jgi:O-antigen/teichoic acid export membrane protein
MDLWNYGDIFSVVASLGWLWLFLAHGFGVLAFAYGNAINAVIIAIYLATACAHLGFFPSRHEIGEITAPLFRSVFGYGKDVFLVALGTQMIVATQPLIVSRILGLEATTTWSIGTKMFTLANQLVTRITVISLPAFAEMIVRQECDRLLHRFRILIAITSSTSAFLGVSLALCNSAFVTIWTSGKINWLPVNDVLLGIWLCILSVQATHNNLVLSTKQVGMLRYVFFAEGCAFIGVAIVLARHYGIPGVITASILCSTLFSFSYGVWRNSRYFAEKPWDILFDWTKPGLKVALVFGTLAIVLWMATGSLTSFPRLVIHGFGTMVIGGLLFLRLGIPIETQRELIGRSPRWSSQFLARIFRNHSSVSR